VADRNISSNLVPHKINFMLSTNMLKTCGNSKHIYARGLLGGDAVY